MKENKRQHTRKNKTGTNLDGSNTDEGWDGLIKGALIPIHDEIVQVDVVSAEDFCGSQDGFSEDRKLHKLSAHAMPLRAHSSKNKPHRTTVWTAFLNKSILYRQINTAKSKNELSFSLNKTIIFITSHLKMSGSNQVCLSYILQPFCAVSHCKGPAVYLVIHLSWDNLPISSWVYVPCFGFLSLFSTVFFFWSSSFSYTCSFPISWLAW